MLTEKVRVVRTKRASASVKAKRKRNYRRRKAKLKRMAKIRRRKPSFKRKERKRRLIKKRMKIKAGSKKRLKLSSVQGLKANLLEGGERVMRKQVKESVTKNLVEDKVQLHSTYQPDVYYVIFSKLPKEAQEILKDAKVEVENSRYTVYEDMAFIRAEVEVNNALWDAEISLGSVDIKNSDYQWSDEEDAYVDDEGRPVDSDEYAETMAKEIAEISEIEDMDVYLTHKEDLEEAVVDEMAKGKEPLEKGDVVKITGGKRKGETAVVHSADEYGAKVFFKDWDHAIWISIDELKRIGGAKKDKGLKEATEKKVGEYEIVDHGIDSSSYFQGHGVYGSKWDETVTGVGSDVESAIEDAAEQLVSQGWELSPELEAEIEEIKKQHGDFTVGYDLTITAHIQENSVEDFHVDASAKGMKIGEGKMDVEPDLDKGTGQIQVRAITLDPAEAVNKMLEALKDDGVEIPDAELNSLENEIQGMQDMNEHYYYMSIDVKEGKGGDDEPLTPFFTKTPKKESKENPKIAKLQEDINGFKKALSQDNKLVESFKKSAELADKLHGVYSDLEKKELAESAPKKLAETVSFGGMTLDLPNFDFQKPHLVEDIDELAGFATKKEKISEEVLALRGVICDLKQISENAKKLMVAAEKNMLAEDDANTFLADMVKYLQDVVSALHDEKKECEKDEEEHEEHEASETEEEEKEEHENEVEKEEGDKEEKPEDEEEEESEDEESEGEEPEEPESEKQDDEKKSEDEEDSEKEAEEPEDKEEVSEAQKSLQPPKGWFAKMKKQIKGTGEKEAKIIGDIWYNKLTPEKRKEIRAREGKQYGPASESVVTEAKSKVKTGKNGNFNYVYNINGVDLASARNFGDSIPHLKKINDFKSNSSVDYIGAKGKLNKKKAIMDWVKDNNPYQFVTGWRDGMDDDSLQVWYLPNPTMKENESVVTENKAGKKDPELFEVPWLKEPIPYKQFEEIADFYNRRWKRAHVRWFDKTGGEGVVVLDDGPLKGFNVKVHGSAFGGDMNFGQDTDFEATEGLKVLVKLMVDSTFIQVERMKLEGPEASKDGAMRLRKAVDAEKAKKAASKEGAIRLRKAVDAIKAKKSGMGESKSLNESAISSVSEFEEILKQGPSPMGYPIYFITADGAALSFEAAKAEQDLIKAAIADKGSDKQWEVIGAEVNWEDPDLYCDHTGKKIECAYCEDEQMEEAKSNKIEKIKAILDNEQSAKVEGTFVDLTTANAIMTVYNGLTKEENKNKFASLPVAEMAKVAWHLIK